MKSARRSITTRSVLAHLLIKAACENLGRDYLEVSSQGKQTFTFPNDPYCPAMDVMRYATNNARCHGASNALAKKVRVSKIKEEGR